MKKIVGIIMALSVLAALPLHAENKRTVAVLPIEPANVDSSVAIQVTDEVQSVFANYSSSYILVDRADINKVLREQALELTGVTEEGVQIGKLLNADAVVMGRIGKIGSHYSLTLKFIDVATGKVERGKTRPSNGSPPCTSLNDIESELVTPLAKYMANPGWATFEDVVGTIASHNQPPKSQNYILSVKGCINLVEPKARIVGQANSWVRVSVGTVVKGRTETAKNTNSPVYANGQFNLDNYLNGIISLDVYDDYTFSGSQYVGRATVTSPVSGTYQILKNGYSWGLVSVEFTPRPEE